jgi:hypothetical protein
MEILLQQHQRNQLQLRLQLQLQLQLVQLEQNERAATARAARVITATSARMNDNLPTTPQQQRQLLHQRLLAHTRNNNFVSNLPASLLSPVNSAPSVSAPSFQQALAWNMLNAEQHWQQRQHQHDQSQNQHQQQPLFPSNTRAIARPAAAPLPQTRFSFSDGRGHDGHHHDQFLRNSAHQSDRTNQDFIRASLQQQFYDPPRQVQRQNEAGSLSSPSFNASPGQRSSPYSPVGNVNKRRESARRTSKKNACANSNAKQNLHAKQNVSINLVSIGTSSLHTGSSKPSPTTTNTTSSTSTTTATAAGVPCTPKIKNTCTSSSSRSSSHSQHEYSKKKSLKTDNHKSSKRKKSKTEGNAKAEGNAKSAISITPTRPPFLANASPLPKSGNTLTQLLSEEIDCGDGLIFEDLDHLSPDHFFQVPGVRKRWYKKTKQKTIQKKTSKKQKVSQESSANAMSNANENELYSARMSISGVSINLGTDHLTSLPAAAALDIAYRLLRGEDNNRPYYVLSEVEVLKALSAIGYGTTLDPGEFKHSFFTQERKEYFESLVDRALSSLGGRDDFYTDILCNLKRYGDTKSAKASANTNPSAVTTVTSRTSAITTETSKTFDASLSSSESIDTSSTKTSRKKSKAAHEEYITPEDLKTPDPDLNHTGEHVIYDVHDDGTYSWRLDESILGNTALSNSAE